MCELNAEQFVWLMTLDPSERRRIARTLGTGQWTLKWNEVIHAFELIPVE